MSTVAMLSSHCSQRTAHHFSEYLVLHLGEFMAKFVTYQWKINSYLTFVTAPDNDSVEVC